jgi:hypothetical protein
MLPQKHNNFEAREQFWNNVACYNFIQEPMTTNKQRPSQKQVLAAWKVWTNLIEILKPTYCIMIGNSSMNTIVKGLQNGQNVKLVNNDWVKKIGTGYVKVAKVQIADHNTEIIAIRHTGSFFSFEGWGGYLKEAYPELMTWYEKNS